MVKRGSSYAEKNAKFFCGPRHGGNHLEDYPYRLIMVWTTKNKERAVTLTAVEEQRGDENGHDGFDVRYLVRESTLMGDLAPADKVNPYEKTKTDKKELLEDDYNAWRASLSPAYQAAEYNAEIAHRQREHIGVFRVRPFKSLFGNKLAKRNQLKTALQGALEQCKGRNGDKAGNVGATTFRYDPEGYPSYYRPRN